MSANAHEPPSDGKSRLIRWVITFILLVGVIFIGIEWNSIQEALHNASWKLVPFALATTLISYLCISSSFARISKLLHVEMSAPDLMRVGFVSVVLNHVVSTGGAAGYSVRYALMNRHGVSFPRVLAVSILHFIFTSMAMLTMLPVGLAYLYVNGAIPGSIGPLLAAAALLVISFGGLVIAVVFSDRLRGRIFGLMERIPHALVREKLGPALGTFDAAIAEGVASLRKNPREFFLLIFLIAADYVASVATLWLAFRSLGVTIPPGTVISGFVIGTVVGVASMIPGGLGVQEGSMAGVFAMLGVSFNQSVIAAVVYRAIYFLLPYLISLGFYHWLLRRGRPDCEVVEVEY